MKAKIVIGAAFALSLFGSAVMAEEVRRPYTPDLAAIHLHAVRKQVITYRPRASMPAKRMRVSASPQLVLALEKFMRRKQCDGLMDRCYQDCKAGGAAPSHCNQTCTTGRQCGWATNQSYGDYLEDEIEALAEAPVTRLARAN
jgi:hypothetical protein